MVRTSSFERKLKRRAQELASREFRKFVSRRAERKLNRRVRKLVGRGQYIQPEWELDSGVHGRDYLPTWFSFRTKEDGLAIAPVDLNGRTYWMVAGMSTDLQKFFGRFVIGFMAAGIFGAAGGALITRPKLNISLWNRDPRQIAGRTGTSLYTEASHYYVWWGKDSDLSTLL